MQQAKLFLRYVDDIVRTVKGDPQKVLRAANLLHPNLQFTIETPNTNGNLAFLDLQISIDKSRKISCGWYQKCNIGPNSTQRRSVEKVPINDWQASVTLILFVFHRLDLAS